MHKVLRDFEGFGSPKTSFEMLSCSVLALFAGFFDVWNFGGFG